MLVTWKYGTTSSYYARQCTALISPASRVQDACKLQIKQGQDDDQGSYYYQLKKKKGSYY
jgi:hypothetical protein